MVKGDAIKKLNISLEKLITILMSNGLSPLYGIANPSRAYSQTVGQGSQGIPPFPGALRPVDLRIVPSLSCDLLSCQLNYLRASPSARLTNFMEREIPYYRFLTPDFAGGDQFLQVMRISKTRAEILMHGFQT